MSSTSHGIEASRKNPCPACQHPSHCLLFPDGDANCYREENGSPKTDKQGDTYWYHPANGAAAPPPPKKAFERETGPKCGTADQLDRVYRELQHQTTLSAEHQADLMGRGMTLATIKERGYRSMPTSPAVRSTIAQSIAELFPFWQSIPGMVLNKYGKPAFTASGGLLIFTFDLDGRIQGVQVRRDNAEIEAALAKGRKLERYFWLSGGGGAKVDHAPVGWWGPACAKGAEAENVKELLVCEGAIKAALAFQFTGTPALSAGAGVGSMASEYIQGMIERVKPELVLVAPDANAFTKSTVENGVRNILARQAEFSARHRHQLKVVAWALEVPAAERPDGIDDALTAGCELVTLGVEEYLDLLPTKPAAPPSDSAPAGLLEDALLALAEPDGGLTEADRHRFAAHLETIQQGKPLAAPERKLVQRTLSKYAGDLNNQGINVNEVAAQELTLAAAAKAAAKKAKAEAAADTPGEASQASKLLDLANDWQMLKSDGQCFASIPSVNPDGTSRRDTIRFSRGGVRKKLQHLFHQAHGSSPSSEALTQAYGTLEALAEFEGTEAKVWMRTATENDRIFVDLCDELGRVVEVSAAGWKVTTDPPVYFYRNQGMQALPEPVRGGSLEELRPFVNCHVKEQFTLAVAWLLNALFPLYPHPILVIEGPQGTGKSTQIRILRSLVDPHAMPFRKSPRSEEDVAMGAFNNWVLAYDNLSDIPPWLSDALCGVASGSGFAKRKLFSDDEESSIPYLRPVVLSGLQGLHGKTDLADRVLKVTLATISEEERKLESELIDDGRWEAARPRILGALFDALSMSLRNRGKKRLSKHPRMADFAQFVVDAEDALPWEPGDFIKAFTQAKTDQIEALLDADPLAGAIRILVSLNGTWEGSATDLLERLSKLTTDGPKSLPNRIKLQSRLKLLEPNLRTVGIEMKFDRQNASRVIMLSRVCVREKTSCPEGGPKQPSQLSLPSQTANPLGFSGDSSPGTTVTNRHSTVTGQPSPRRVSDSSGNQPSPTVTEPSPKKPLFNGLCDSSDGCDSSFDQPSGGSSFSPARNHATPIERLTGMNRQEAAAEVNRRLALADDEEVI